MDYFNLYDNDLIIPNSLTDTYELYHDIRNLNTNDIFSNDDVANDYILESEMFNKTDLNIQDDIT